MKPSKLPGKIPVRILDFDSSSGCGDENSGNLIMQDDNLKVLKSLLPFYRGQVKCIYLDKRTAYLIQANEREKSSQSLDTRACEDLQDYGAAA